MATIKSHTDIEQSKKLAEILPIESADMYYHYTTGVKSYHEDVPNYVQVFNHFVFFHYDIPCWSLASLLSILPNNEHITTSVSRGRWQIEPINYLPNTWWCEYEDNESLTDFNVSAENPVDACVEMILKLHERKML